MEVITFVISGCDFHAHKMAADSVYVLIEMKAEEGHWKELGPLRFHRTHLESDRYDSFKFSDDTLRLTQNLLRLDRHH